MRFAEAPLDGVWLIEADRIEDERGWFARTYDREELAARGIDPAVAQCNVSFNARAGTLRGMHYQAAPHGEPKLVRCTRGAIFDVVVDLRRESATHTQWFGTQLSAENGRSLYVPEGFAHGFQTLLDDSDVLYMMGREYVPEAASGVRWDDRAFAIAWPEVAERVMSARDRGYADYLG